MSLLEEIGKVYSIIAKGMDLFASYYNITAKPADSN